MNTFYFNTGVKPENVPNWKGLYDGHVMRGGTVQIPFECDAPQSASFMFACDKNNLPESNMEGWIVAKIKQPSGLLSKFAYFRVVS